MTQESAAWRVGGFVLLVVSLAFGMGMVLGPVVATLITLIGAGICFLSAFSVRPKQQKRITELV